MQIGQKDADFWRTPKLLDNKLGGQIMKKQETREEMYKKALELARSAYKQDTHCSLIMDALHKGRIKEGRINFLALEGFNTYLGRHERKLIEEEGGFELSVIVYKSLENDKVNKKLIQEATLTKKRDIRADS